MPLIDDIRRAIEADPRHDARLAADAGVNRSIVCRLRQGEGVSVDNAERLADALGYDVALKRRPKRRKART